MSEKGLSAVALTRRGIAEAEKGNLEAARLNLAEALGVDPKYEPAWLWFASVAENDGERRFCLEKAIGINADSSARVQLARLKKVDEQLPKELEGIVDPPPPPDLTGAAFREAEQEGQRRWWLLGGMLALVALAALGAFLLGNRPASEGAPVQIAVAVPLTGPSATNGQEVLDSVRLYVDQMNQDGGVAGHPIELKVYDDEGNPDTAQQVAQEIVNEGKALFVIGHTLSSTSMAAGPIYQKAGIVAITPTASAPGVTGDNPWYFRMTVDNVTEGLMIAAYAHGELGAEHITILHENSEFGRTLAGGVVDGAKGILEIRNNLELDTSTDDATTAKSIADAVEKVKADKDTGPIAILMQAAPSRSLLIALRQAGVTEQIIGGDSMGSNGFLQSVGEAVGDPAAVPTLTDGLLANAPIFMDGLTSESLRWANAFVEAYDRQPGWRGATAYDSAIAGVHALGEALKGGAGDLAAQRTAIRDTLAAMENPDNGIAGILGPIVFDQTRTVIRGVDFGVARNGEFISMPIQYSSFTPSPAVDLKEELANGTVIDADGQYLQQQRIVFAGINVNQVGDLDLSNQTFVADFFIWLKYPGDDTAADIVFLNAVDPKLSIGTPVKTSKADGVTYGLYRVKGKFQSALQFKEFPFDKQQLQIEFANRSLPSSKLVFAIEPALIDMPMDERLASGMDASVSINDIPNWEASSLQFYQGSVGSTAMLGDPNAKASDPGVEFSTFTADITIERDLRAFLIKNLLPLALLATVTYVSLFFPVEDTATRVSFGITGILTSAVLMGEVTKSLPDVGYTVAIEWIYYAFILLSALLILFGIIGQRLHKDRRLTALHRLNVFARIFYPLFLLTIAVVYWVRFG